VPIRGFGAFELRKLKGKKIMCPGTGESEFSKEEKLNLLRDCKLFDRRKNIVRLLRSWVVPFSISWGTTPGGYSKFLAYTKHY